ncbi:HU family DNA-binding protein [Luteococcus sp. Sow4_B9]|uniref:HU family DNA-binding protein n=1 Tax=Luteococcus sp. Sow4_B9 TaxID=3438792 RepID=UPI003F998216
MNKAELIDSLAKGHFEGNKAVATRALNAVVDTIATEVANTGKVSITGFGVFEVLHREARVVRNPRTGERKQAEAMDLPRFRPGTDFKKRVQDAADKR